MMMHLIAQRYELIGEIGSGGMGTVYRGFDHQLQRPIAIKHLQRTSRQPEHIARFIREGEALRALNHPNIVTLLDAVQEGDDHYLILEYLPGGDLAALLTQGQLVFEQLLNVAIDIADALTRAHRLNIIHRDLKPANVLLAEDGTPRLTDFGIAHIESAERLTGTGAVFGTTYYLSPEALGGEDIHTGMDIWSFGVLLFEMVTGQLPFQGATSSQVITAILFEPVPDIEALRPGCPMALVDLIYRMLDKDPRARISSARLVGLELEAILANANRAHASQRTEPRASPHGNSERFSVSGPQHLFKNKLPRQAFPFVGREPELKGLATLIADRDVRLVTVLGPGGMGKTRLVLQSAEEQADTFLHGAYFVELASLSTATMIIPTIAEAVGFSFREGDLLPTQQLLDYLSEKRLLLLLDNFEHLLSGVELVERILQSAPYVKVIVTSRERLNLSAETLFNLGGMNVPDHAATDSALSYSGVQLFVQSARRVRPNFELKPADVESIIRICQSVEGMPLGIVLAAAWVEMLSPEEIVVELKRSVDFLETDWRDLPERQRSLRAMFNYSWWLLSESEQTLLMKLSIFRGGFTREAAEKVTGASLRALMSLMNKSLLSRNRDSGRYSLHQLTHQYMDEKLRISEYFDETARLHATYYLQENDGSARYWWRCGSIEARRSFEIDAENIHAAWSFVVDAHDTDLLALGAEDIYVFYTLMNWITEGRRLYYAALTVLPDRTSETAGKLLLGLASFDQDTASFALSESYSQQAIDILRQCGSTRALGKALETLGYVKFTDGRMDESDRVSWEAYQIAQRLGEDFLAFRLTNQLALNARHRKDFAEARRLTEMLLQTHPKDQVDPAVLLALQTLAASAREMGDLTQAKDLMQTTLTLARESGDLWNIAGTLIWLALFHFGEQDFVRANDYGEQGLEAALKLEVTFMIATAESVLSGIASVTGNFSAAKARLRSALLRSYRLPPHRGLLRALPAAPVFLTLSGSPAQALEIISLLSNTANIDPIVLSLLTPFRALCETHLTPDAAQASWERGKTLDLDETVQRLLDMLGTE